MLYYYILNYNTMNYNLKLSGEAIAEMFHSVIYVSFLVEK